MGVGAVAGCCVNTDGAHDDPDTRSTTVTVSVIPGICAMGGTESSRMIRGMKLTELCGGMINVSDRTMMFG
jgi:hypothetical protein